MDLSDVTASKLLEGEIAIEKMIAGSTPRRSSATFEQFNIDHTLINVPYALSAHFILHSLASSLSLHFHLQWLEYFLQD